MPISIDNETDHQEPTGIGLHDACFAIYRHKWKMIVFTILGIVAAAAFYLFAPRFYQSNAQLLVKYVVNRGAIDAADSQTEVTGRYSDTLIGAELATLASRDLAVQTVETIGAGRVLEGETGEHSVERAANVVGSGLEIKAPKGGNVISVSFQATNRNLAQPVLEEFVRRYFDKHLEVHRSMQAFDFVSQQKDLVRARLNDLDAKIQNLKTQAGISSSADNEGNLQSQIVRTRQELLTSETERAAQAARSAYTARYMGMPITVLERAPASSVATEANAAVPPGVAQEYQFLLGQLEAARKSEAALLSKFTEQTSEVKAAQGARRLLESRQASLEKQFPKLSAATALPNEKPVDLLIEQAQLAATEAKTATLKAQLQDLQTAAEKIGAVSAQLQDLESQRLLEQKNYADFQMKLEKSRIDEALDPSKIPNISTLQKPSPAVRVEGKRIKIAAGLAIAGLVLGLGCALLYGLIFDQTIKRPGELESRFQIPFFFSIPFFSKKPQVLRKGERSRRLRELQSASNGEKLLPWDTSHFIRAAAEAIRDRLILGFELKKTIHKPKLIGVTGLAGGEGASTMAGGLAASLSETGDGKVLLVDMNTDNPEMRPFFEGGASGSLLHALEAGRQMPSVVENLFLANGESGTQGSMTIAPKRFYDLMPILRASHFDYIIFDLPPLNDSGATLALSGVLDKLLLLVELEKSERSDLKRAHAELKTARADVSVIINKLSPALPRWLAA